LELVESAAKKLGIAFDVEVSEIHHRHKRDAPSGTALALTQAVQRGRGAMRVVQGRAGTGPARDKSELGVAALRGGDVAGEHTVYYFGDNERLEITHRAGNADIFARGALAAAEWIYGKPAGRYSMRDVLAAR
ncbi:MAG: 4-hydroxy-tetrahydrodipicolinate reductase, partial [Actinomycetota bacterium]